MRQTTYLLRSAVYVVLLTAVCVIPFALAQRDSSKSSSAQGRWQLPSLSDLASAGQAMRIPSLPVSQLSTRASGPVGVSTPTPKPTPGPCQFQVLIVYADPKPPTQLLLEIQAEPNVVAVDLFDASNATPTLGQLQQYEIVVPFSDLAFLDADTLGNNLADYVDGGGIVVQYGFAHAGPGDPAGINGRWLTDGYNPYDYSENLETNPFSLGAFNAGHPLMVGVATLNSDFANVVTPNAAATEVAQNSLGESLVAYRPVDYSHYCGRYSLCRNRCYTKR